jgi:CheY-like chemotaxis protein
MPDSSQRKGEPGARSGQGAGSIPGHVSQDLNRRSSFARTASTILVVDDTEASRYATARSLQAIGFTVIEASGGARCLELAESASAVVLDVHLPDLNGLEVCRILRSRPATARLPIIHVSAIYVRDEDREAAKHAGADCYLVAPVSIEVLAGKLDELLRAAPGARGGS